MTASVRKPPPHGTRARYQGTFLRPPCDCAKCREANRAYAEEQRRAAGVKPMKEGRTRGTVSCYMTKCGHDECRAAYTQYRYEKRYESKAQ